MILGNIGGKIFKKNINCSKHRRNHDAQKWNWLYEISFMLLSKMTHIFNVPIFGLIETQRRCFEYDNCTI